MLAPCLPNCPSGKWCFEIWYGIRVSGVFNQIRLVAAVWLRQFSAQIIAKSDNFLRKRLTKFNFGSKFRIRGAGQPYSGQVTLVTVWYASVGDHVVTEKYSPVGTCCPRSSKRVGGCRQVTSGVIIHLGIRYAEPSPWVLPPDCFRISLTFFACIQQHVFNRFHSNALKPILS